MIPNLTSELAGILVGIVFVNLLINRHDRNKQLRRRAADAIEACRLACEKFRVSFDQTLLGEARAHVATIESITEDGALNSEFSTAEIRVLSGWLALGATYYRAGQAFFASMNEADFRSMRFRSRSPDFTARGDAALDVTTEDWFTSLQEILDLLRRPFIRDNRMIARLLDDAHDRFRDVFDESSEARALHSEISDANFIRSQFVERLDLLTSHSIRAASIMLKEALPSTWLSPQATTHNIRMPPAN